MEPFRASYLLVKARNGVGSWFRQLAFCADGKSERAQEPTCGLTSCNGERH